MPAQVVERAGHNGSAMRGIRMTISLGLAGAAVLTPGACAAPVSAAATTAPAEVSTAYIEPSFFPDRLDAKSSLTFTIRYAGGEDGVPSPVRRSVLRFPVGVSLDVPELRDCPLSRLRARGVGGCPPQSKLGYGNALVEVRAGSQTLTENVSMSIFLGAPRNLEPTLEILARGYTPFDERVVLIGSMLSDRPPYGQALSIVIPPIRTLTFEPDASIVKFSLVIGGEHTEHQTAADAVLLPSSCPVGGFPFAAAFTYANGSSASAVASAPCPR
jgi:hypothetical protein